MKEEQYLKFIEQYKPKKKKGKNLLNAFLFGGLIAIVGQGLFDFYSSITKLSDVDCSTLMIVTIIFAASLLTGVGVFDKFASYAGAGSFVPITGFSNALTSCALEGRSEGLIFGIGSNMFKLAGSVLVYGVVSAYIVNIVRYLFLLIGG